jgi:hypothetical protein
MPTCRTVAMCVAAAWLAASAAGCATLTSGTHETISVSSDPPGAHVQVLGRDTLYTTPAEVRVHRPTEDYLLISKDGYHSVRVRLEREIHKAGELSLALLYPGAIDLMTGAIVGNAQADVHVVLTMRREGEMLQVREWWPPADTGPEDTGGAQ